MTVLCHNCPDHEACMTGWPCEVVKRYSPAPFEPFAPEPLVWEGDYA